MIATHPESTTFQMADLEAQHGTTSTHNASGTSVSSGSASSHSVRPTAYPNSYEGSGNDEDEQVGLYNLAEKLRNQDPAVEPWFLEMSRLRRIYVLWLNKRLALCRKSILTNRKASDEDMKALGEVLHLQGKNIRNVFETRPLLTLRS
jgi:hypothetical protein